MDPFRGCFRSRSVLNRGLRSAADALAGLAYPEICRICEGDVESLDLGVCCSACWSDPETTPLFLHHQVCSRCGLPLRSPKTNSSSDLSCGTCRDWNISAARACGPYDGALKQSILFLKEKPHVPSRLRSILIDTFGKNEVSLKADLVIPVPLHRSRARERGFNQSRLIARILSDGIGIPVDEYSLIRIKPTGRHRAGMDVVDRAASIRKAFSVVRPKMINDSRVLLVDDLCTTGSTIREAAATLLESGATAVAALTIARAV